jgi:hypothetical protein
MENSENKKRLVGRITLVYCPLNTLFLIIAQLKSLPELVHK